MAPDESNRDKLLRKALDLFAARGYDAVGVRDIVSAAGVTKPTLYHYFRSKRGLFEALLAAFGEPLVLGLARDVTYRRDVVMSLRSVVSVYFTRFKARPEFFRLLLSHYYVPEDSEVHGPLEAFNLRVFGIVEALFKAAEADHGNMRGRSTAFAATFLGTIHTYLGLSLRGYTEPSDELCRNLVRQFMHGIFS